MHFADFDKAMGQTKLHIPNYLLTGHFGNKERQNVNAFCSVLITMVIVLITIMMMLKKITSSDWKKAVSPVLICQTEANAFIAFFSWMLALLGTEMLSTWFVVIHDWLFS